MHDGFGCQGGRVLLLLLAAASALSAQPPDLFAPVASYEEMRSVGRSIAAQQTPPAADPGWWSDLVQRPIGGQPERIEMSLEQALIGALNHSKQVKVFSELPLIRETAVTEAGAAFDWTTFMNARWDDRSDPIGSDLTAGAGATRFRDHQVGVSGGARRRTHTGAQLQASQDFGFQSNNSVFFVPNPQGTSRLNLSFTQPLLRGRGRIYNNSLIVLAQIDKAVADDEFRRQLETHLLEVSRAYWALYLERAVWYQKTNSYLRGRRVLERLEQRRGLDAQGSQIVSAQAAIKQREAELSRAAAAVRNAEARLRALINDPQLLSAELIPIDMPQFEFQPVELNEVVAVAFQQRPEVVQAVKQVRAGAVRLNMSKHEMLPMLNLVTEAYVAGLQDRGQVFDAWARQFSVGEPGYGVGLLYEVPIHRRAARARLQRRQIELRQLEAQYATTLETVRLEAEVAVREMRTAHAELLTKRQAMLAREAQLNALAMRWSSLPGEDVASSLALENLLLAQERLAEAEFGYLKSQLTYNLSLVNLKRAAGLLMRHEQVAAARVCEGGVPRTVLAKPDLSLEEFEVLPLPLGVPTTSQPLPGEDSPAVPIEALQLPEPTAPAAPPSDATPLGPSLQSARVTHETPPPVIIGRLRPEIR